MEKYLINYNAEQVNEAIGKALKGNGVPVIKIEMNPATGNFILATPNEEIDAIYESVKDGNAVASTIVKVEQEDMRAFVHAYLSGVGVLQGEFAVDGLKDMFFSVYSPDMAGVNFVVTNLDMETGLLTEGWNVVTNL